VTVTAFFSNLYTSIATPISTHLASVSVFEPREKDLTVTVISRGKKTATPESGKSGGETPREARGSPNPAPPWGRRTAPRDPAKSPPSGRRPVGWRDRRLAAVVDLYLAGL
jgi:hypothetical protein